MKGEEKRREEKRREEKIRGQKQDLGTERWYDLAVSIEFGTQFEASLGDRGLFWSPRTPLLDHFGGSWGPFCAIFGPCGLLRCAAQVTRGPKGFTLDTQLASGANPPSLFAVF